MKLLGGLYVDLGDYIPWLAQVNRFNGLDEKVNKVAQEFDQFLDGVVEEHLNGLDEKKKRWIWWRQK